jgi:hypothetical protein
MFGCCDANAPASFGRTLPHDMVARGTPDEQVSFATLLLDAGGRLDVRDDLLMSTPLGWRADGAASSW